MRCHSLDSTLRSSSCSFFPARAPNRETFEGAGVPAPEGPHTMLSPTGYSVSSDSFMAAVDLSAGALFCSPSCPDKLKLGHPRTNSII